MRFGLNFRNLIIYTFISIFIVLYILFLFQFYIIPNDFKISIVILSGFAIIIIGIFYFFLKINYYNKIIVRIKILEENSIKTILIILMAVSIFIPTISFSDIIIAWSQIPIENYVRAVFFLIGALFIPGACLFNIIFPKNIIHERLGVESFLVKITIYPIISLIYLGSVTLILDFIGFTGDFILLFLFFSFIFLFYLDILFQKKHGTKIKIKKSEITISRDTFLILLIGLGIVIIALGVLLSSHQYILAGDRWRGISSASLIGEGDFGSSQNTYTKYWGSISFGLSVLCGIPYINTNVLLFPFLYLSITSIYLLTKILLKNMNEKFCVLSSIFIVIMFDPIKLIFQLSFHSFAFFTLFNSLTLFFIVIKSDNLEKRSNLTTKNIVLLALSSLFLVQSFMLYILPAVMGLLIIFLYSLFSMNLKQYLRILLIFYIFFIIILLIFDLIALNFFSFWCFQHLSGFSGIPFNFVYISPYSLRITLTSLLFYTFLLSSLFLLYFLYKFSKYLSIIVQKAKDITKLILRKKYKNWIFYLFIFFSIFLLIVNLNFYFLIFYIKEANLHLNFLSFYLNTLIISIGFFGIFGIYLSFLCYKENKNLFFFLFSWIVLIIGLASSLIFLRWMQYPTSLVSNIPEKYNNMTYWFSRTWYYSMIPLSIFISIGLVKLIKKLKTRNGWSFYPYKEKNSVLSLSLVSLLIFVSFSTAITRVIYWDNYYATTNEEAQIIGWTSKNIPIDSKILITRWPFRNMLERDLYLYKTYYLHEVMNSTDYEIKELMDNLTSKNIVYFIFDKQYESKYIELLNNFYTIKLYEYGSFSVMSNKSI